MKQKTDGAWIPFTEWRSRGKGRKGRRAGALAKALSVAQRGALTRRQVRSILEATDTTTDAPASEREAT